jgi:hypothetical protein
MNEENPYGVCTWGDEADCECCGLDELLDCRFDSRRIAVFAAIALPAMASAAVGMALSSYITGSWAAQFAYLVFVVSFFTVVEALLLCRHCPYYARSGATIRCHANYGLPRLWRFNPAPMSRLERMGLLLCFAFFGLFPVAVEAGGLFYLLSSGSALSSTALLLACVTAATLGLVLVFFYLLRRLFCPRCVNFSCPLNRASSESVEQYLQRNPAMRDAWGRSRPPDS